MPDKFRKVKRRTVSSVRHTIDKSCFLGFCHKPCFEAPWVSIIIEFLIRLWKDISLCDKELFWNKVACNMLFSGKLDILPHIVRRKIKIQCLVYENCRALNSQWKQWNIWCFSAWFQQQEEFNSTIEEMTPQQLNNCLQKFYLSARRRDGTFYNKKSLTAIRAALDRNFCGIIGPLLIQLVCYVPKQLFTSVPVNSGGYLPRHVGE